MAIQMIGNFNSFYGVNLIQKKPFHFNIHDEGRYIDHKPGMRYLRLTSMNTRYSSLVATPTHVLLNRLSVTSVVCRG